MSFTPQTAAEALLARLYANGLDALFANGGTDFASIIEAYARGGPAGALFPEPVIAPHETAAVAIWQRASRRRSWRMSQSVWRIA